MAEGGEKKTSCSLFAVRWLVGERESFSMEKVTATKSPQRLARSPASPAPTVTYARPRASDPRN